MTRSALPLGLAVLALAGDAAALRFQVTARPSSKSAQILGRRQAASDDYGSSQLNNTNDFSYYTDVVLNGTTFDALIDTGRCVRNPVAAAKLWLTENKRPLFRFQLRPLGRRPRSGRT